LTLCFLDVPKTTNQLQPETPKKLERATITYNLDSFKIWFGWRDDLESSSGLEPGWIEEEIGKKKPDVTWWVNPSIRLQSVNFF